MLGQKGGEHTYVPWFYVMYVHHALCQDIVIICMTVPGIKAVTLTKWHRICLRKNGLNTQGHGEHRTQGNR